MSNTLIEVVTVLVLVSGIIIIGFKAESQFQLPQGSGPSLVFISIQLLVSALTLNPAMNAFGLKMLSVLIIFLLGVTTLRLSFSIDWRTASKTIIVPILASVSLFYFWEPGERSWDGAGYHNVISLIARQEGTIWGWPNLMWAQWFPANQELFSGAVSAVTNSYSSFFVPNIMWFATTIFFISRNVPDKFGWKARALIPTLAALSIPVIVTQTGTSYVDFQTMFCTLIIITVLIPKQDKKSLLVAIFLASAGLTSSKWSGIVFLPILILISLVYNSEFISRASAKKVFSALVGGIAGLAPVVIRNSIEFQSPTFPFKGPMGIWSGLFEQSLMTDQIGNANMPIELRNGPYAAALIYQYLISPFEYVMRSMKGLLNFVLESHRNLSDEKLQLVNYVSYDARLGGFGAITTLALIIVLVSLRKNLRSLSVCFIAISPILLLPMGWWPRYYLGFALIILYIYRENLTEIIAKSKLFSNLAIVSVTFMASLNASGAVGFGHIQKSSWTSNTGYGQGISSALPKSCERILVVGEGLTFSSGLWGERMCNEVVGSLHFGNEQETLGQFGSVKIEETLDVSQDIKKYLDINKTLVIVFTNDVLDGQPWYESAISTLKRESFVLSSVKSSEVNGHPFHMLLVRSV